jgi:hypothetical protein
MGGACLPHRVPAGLVLPVIVAAAQGKVLFRPDDLGADVKARILQRRSHFSGVQPGMPDIGDISAKQLVCFAPVHAIVVLHGSGLPLLTEAGFFPPLRVVSDSIGRVSDHEHRNRRSAQPFDIGRNGRVAAHDAVFSTEPEIARCAGYGVRRLRNRFECLVIEHGRKKLFDVASIEAGELQFEIGFAEFGDLLGYSFEIPLGPGGRAIRHEAKSVYLFGAPVTAHNHRQLGVLQLLRCLEAKLAVDDDVLFGDE